MLIEQAIVRELQEAQKVLQTFVEDQDKLNQIALAAEVMSDAIKSGGKIISCGNGGSHCDAMHFAEELTGRYRESRVALPAIAISDSSHISCVGNDYGYNEIFARYLQALGQKEDVLLAISTSGHSKNIIRAIEEAHKKGLCVVALTGKDGGKIQAMLNERDIEIRVAHFGYADRIQEVHIKIIHILIMLIENKVL